MNSAVQCQHKFRLRFEDVVAKFEKRDGGEPIYCDGDFYECTECYDGQFVPFDKNLRTVPCDMVVTGFKAKEPF